MDQRPDLAPILDDEGFQHVAAAIRRATVSEQFFKARNKRQDYEIRYGLLQDLQRKARFREHFLDELATFITAYNVENARKAEQIAQSGQASSFKRWRPQVTTNDLTSIVQLFDRHSPETVAMLLLAYAAASNRGSTPAADEAPDDGGIPDADGETADMTE